MAQAPDPKIARLMQMQGYLNGQSARGERLIIVGGAPRSGTTMFQSMMNSHPQIHGGPEFDHLCDIVRLHETLSLGLQHQRIDLFVNQVQLQLNERRANVAGMPQHAVRRSAQNHGATSNEEARPWQLLRA